MNDSNPTETTPTNTPATRGPRTRGRAPEGVAYPKEIKSFVRRAGRTTTGQAKALEDMGPQFLLPYQTNAIDFVAAYEDATGARAAPYP